MKLGNINRGTNCKSYDRWRFVWTFCALCDLFSRKRLVHLYCIDMVHIGENISIHFLQTMHSIYALGLPHACLPCLSSMWASIVSLSQFALSSESSFASCAVTTPPWYSRTWGIMGICIQTCKHTKIQTY